MFEKLKSMYLAGKITESNLTIAVQKGWITEEQKQEIMNRDRLP